MGIVTERFEVIAILYALFIAEGKIGMFPVEAKYESTLSSKGLS